MILVDALIRLARERQALLAIGHDYHRHTIHRRVIAKALWANRQESQTLIDAVLGR